MQGKVRVEVLYLHNLKSRPNYRGKVNREMQKVDSTQYDWLFLIKMANNAMPKYHLWI